MSTAHEQTNKSSVCPTKQMSFGEAVRYLQGGFDEPVQRAIAGHVQYCNSCQEELERVSALRGAGEEILLSDRDRSAEHSDSDDDSGTNGGGNGVQRTFDKQIPEAILAAYLDGKLPDDEHSRVTDSIAGSYENYVRFSALKAELAKPLDASNAAPDKALKLVQTPVTIIENTTDDSVMETPLQILIQRITQGAQSLLALRWAAPATAFAVGALLMVMFLPKQETVVSLPGLAASSGETSDHIRSGIGDAEAAPAETVLQLRRRQNVAFSWKKSTVPTVQSYRVDVTDPSGQSAFAPLVTDENSIKIAAKKLRPGTVYTVSVLAVLDNGGMMPVSRHTIQLER